MGQVSDAIYQGTAQLQGQRSDSARIRLGDAELSQRKVESDRNYGINLRNVASQEKQVGMQEEQLGMQREAHSANMVAIKEAQEQAAKARGNKFVQDWSMNLNSMIDQRNMLESDIAQAEREAAAAENHAVKTNTTANGPRVGKEVPKDAKALQAQKSSPINDTLQLANDVSNKRMQAEQLRTQLAAVQNSINTHTLSFLRNKAAVYTAINSDISNLYIKDLLDKAYRTDDPVLQEQYAQEIVKAEAMANMLADRQAQAKFEQEYKLKIGPAIAAAEAQTPRQQKISEINAPLVSGINSFIKSNLVAMFGNMDFGDNSLVEQTLNEAIKGLSTLEPEELQIEAQKIPKIVDDLNVSFRSLSYTDAKLGRGVNWKANQLQADKILAKLEKKRGELSSQTFTILSTYANLVINNPEMAAKAPGKLPSIPENE